MYYDENNAHGKGVWGQEGTGCIVVAYRGEESFEQICRNAEASDAVAVVIIDKSDELDNKMEMSLLDKSSRRPPLVPAVCVPLSCSEILSCKKSVTASIVRR